MSPQPRCYTAAEVSLLVEALGTPACAIREGVFVCANAHMAQVAGRPADSLPGQPFSVAVRPEDAERVDARIRRMGEGSLTPTREAQRRVLLGADGVSREAWAHVTVLPATEGPPFLLMVVLLAAERLRTVDLAERAVEVAAALVGARTEAEVRAAATEGLAQAGFSVSFLRPAAPPPDVSGEELALAAQALASGRVLFGGVETVEPTCAFLPLPAAGEVLWLRGPMLPHSSGPSLTLFARVLSGALQAARLLAETEQRNDELCAVAEVARLAAEPALPSLEMVLSRVAAAVDAEGALLWTGSPPRLLALSGPERRVADGVPGEWAGLPRLEVPLGPEEGEGRVVLEVVRQEGRPFDIHAERLLQTLGDLLRCVLEQQRLRQESARQLSETQLLLELARTTAGTLDTSSILDVASDFLVRLLDVSHCFILLYQEQSGVLEGAAASAVHRSFFRTQRFSVDGPGVAARVARERRPVAVEDVAAAHPGSYHPDMVAHFGDRAILGLPLLSREELIGVVVLNDTRGPRRFSAEVLALAQATVGQIALSVANARLYESLWRSYADLAATRAEMVKRERLAALGELSAIVAHEVRNPLGVIFNAVSSLRRLSGTRGDAAMLLDILAEESDRLNRIVSDLLDFSRPRTLDLQPEEVGALIQDAVDAARSQPGEGCGPITFQARVDAGLPRVPMDRRLFRQALVNVMVNALQAMPRGGTVRVEARRETAAGGLRIDVCDDGPGIPPELRARIFEPFFTTKAKGTGLGLAVVKRIVEEHQGEVTVDSRTGEGTTFTFRLPLPTGLAAGEGGGRP